MPTSWGTTPARSVAAECDRRGRRAVVEGCVAILEHRSIDPALLVALAGPAATSVLAGAAGGVSGPWPRVWAARGLLHAFGDEATTAIVRATGDEAWRVREMAAKVVARHGVDDALDAVASLRADPVPRVRAAAERAVRRLVELGARPAPRGPAR